MSAAMTRCSLLLSLFAVGSATPAATNASNATAPQLSRASQGSEAVGGSGGSTIRVINGCGEAMWIAHCCNYNYRQNVKIEAGSSHDFPAYAGLMGFRLWPKLRPFQPGKAED
eukprot:Skav205907  [mRNA]  locus=scaffold123:441686:443828:+ [translate_table: standard]